MKIHLRTGEIARILGISVPAIRRWIDTGDEQGKLKGFRMPMSKTRLVSREELVRFLTARGWPEMPPELLQEANHARAVKKRK